MKAVTWLAAAAMSVAAISPSVSAEPVDGWSTDIEAALAQAKKENKVVLLEFTGSDWCTPCIIVNKQVFAKKEFIEKASENFVLVKVDVPKKDKEMAARNLMVREKYKVDGYPMVLLLNQDGKEFYRFYAADELEVDKVLVRLKTGLGQKDAG